VTGSLAIARDDGVRKLRMTAELRNEP